MPAIQRVLAIPAKRFDKPLRGFLSRSEGQAVVEAPDNATGGGRRDRVLLAALHRAHAGPRSSP